MKKRILFQLAILTCAFTFMQGQNNFIELTFTATSQGEPIPLDSVFVQNLTQGCDTMLFAPDTVLLLDFSTDIFETAVFSANDFSISQNSPNPFTDKTIFSVTIAEKGSVLIFVRNLVGQEVAALNVVLETGSHQFTFYSGDDKFYLLSVIYNGKTKSLKMISHGRSNRAKLTYTGSGNFSSFLKSQIKSGFPFSIGDQLRFTGYAATLTYSTGSDEITDTPQTNNTYHFNIIEGIRCPGMPTVYDIDGNSYNTVLMGDQCWMKENLKTTKFKSGIPIPYVPGYSDWFNLTTDAYAWYDNDTIFKDNYGALYNGYAIGLAKGLCPDGWHVPSADDLDELLYFIGGPYSSNGNKLKSCRQDDSPLGGACNISDHPRWDLHGTHYGTDDFGFSSLPGGWRATDGYFYSQGISGNWWTTTEISSMFTWYFGLYYHTNYIELNGWNKNQGLSVRCLRDPEAPPTTDFTSNITGGTAPLSVQFADQSGYSPFAWFWEFGDGETSTQQNPMHTYTNVGSYTVQLTVTNAYGSYTEVKTDYISVFGPCPEANSVTDIDGNVYNTILIGGQCWMSENLKTTTFKNGTPVPNVTDPVSWSNLTTGAYVWNNNDISWKDKYGALYNWHAVGDQNGLCPEGWHVPTNGEWMILTNLIGGTGTPNGDKLKSCRQVDSPSGGDCNTEIHPRWAFYSTSVYGMDAYGFSILPGGYRYFDGGFDFPGYFTALWTATEDSSIYAFIREFSYSSSFLTTGYLEKSFGLSVRCLKN